MSEQALKAAFESLSNALATGDLAGFYGLMHPNAVVIDEDIPFLGRRAEFEQHIDWHISGIWESFSWNPKTPRFIARENGGAVVGNAIFRGKPIDSGYRQRYLFFSQGWVKTDNLWQMVSWHQSTLDGHVLNGSPG